MGLLLLLAVANRLFSLAPWTGTAIFPVFWVQTAFSTSVIPSIGPAGFAIG
jgi:hypothetical protein